MSGLPPPRIITQQDTAGQDGVSESSDDHFSSASEGDDNNSNNDNNRNNPPQSPIPMTRVERVDDKAAHGEVPGTPAYHLRTQDAVPDELEIVPEGRRSRSATTTSTAAAVASRSRSHSHLSDTSRPATPGGTPIPKTIVERVDDKPTHGEVEGTPAWQLRRGDAEPDEVRQAPAVAKQTDDGSRGETSGPAQVEQDPEDRQAWFRSMWEAKAADPPPSPHQTTPHDNIEDHHEEQDNAAAVVDDDDDEDDFGDDFDDFAEGADGDDDFGDFDQADHTPAPLPLPETQHSQSAPLPSALSHFPPLHLTLDLSQPELQDTLNPYLDILFPNIPPTPPPSSLPPLDLANSSPFLSDRSLSLWQQLVSPPPMQPPNWTRSRIRRLFLVSLGVPVDLDEILPPSKQKRLVLPNINLTSPRASTAQLDRIKQGSGNDSTTSLDSKTGEPKSKKSGLKRSGTVKGPPPEPEFDCNRAALVCRTTDEALQRMNEVELRGHRATLEALNREASGVLEYWLQRKDEALKEKEALEGVVANLVGFVKGRRGGK